MMSEYQLLNNDGCVAPKKGGILLCASAREAMELAAENQSKCPEVEATRLLIDFLRAEITKAAENGYYKLDKGYNLVLSTSNISNIQKIQEDVCEDLSRRGFHIEYFNVSTSSTIIDELHHRAIIYVNRVNIEVHWECNSEE